LVWRCPASVCGEAKNQITDGRKPQPWRTRVQAKPIVFDGAKNACSFENWQEKIHYRDWLSFAH
jgi:hypothetical protein